MSKVAVSIELVPEEPLFVGEDGSARQAVADVWFDGGVPVPAVGEEVQWIEHAPTLSAKRSRIFSFMVVRRAMSYWHERGENRAGVILYVRWPHVGETWCPFAEPLPVRPGEKGEGGG